MRVVVLSAAGKHFTSGLSLTDSGPKLLALVSDKSMDVARRAFKIHEVVRHYQAAFTAIEQCGVPVIAAVQVRAAWWFIAAECAG